MLKPAKIVKVCANCKGTKTITIDTNTWIESDPWTQHTTKGCEHSWILLACDERIPQKILDIYNLNPSSKPLENLRKRKFNNDQEALSRWIHGE